MQHLGGQNPAELAMFPGEKKQGEKKTRKNPKGTTFVLLAEIMFFGRMFEKCLGTSD